MTTASDELDAGAPGFTQLLAAGLGAPDPEDRPSRLGGWLTRLLAPGPGRPWRIYKVRPMDDGGFFRGWRIAEVFVFGAPRLEGTMLPSGGSFGLFARTTAGRAPRALYLSRRRRHLEEVLRDEGRPLTEARPAALAAIVMEALGRRGNDSHTVVASTEQVAGFGYLYGADGFVADRAELRRCGPDIEAPRITEDAGGWTLTCCTVFGWMHDKRRLLRHEVRVRRDDWTLALRSRVLSPAIFRAVPGLRY